MHTGGENLSEGNHFEEPGIDGGIILKLMFEKWDGSRTRSICSRIKTGDRLL